MVVLGEEAVDQGGIGSRGAVVVGVAEGDLQRFEAAVAGEDERGLMLNVWNPAWKRMTGTTVRARRPSTSAR